MPAVPLHDAVWWALAATIAVLGAMLLWMVVAPVSPLGEWRPAGVRVMSPAARSALFAAFGRLGLELLDALLPLPQPVRLMGLGLSSLEGEEGEADHEPAALAAIDQLSLF